MLSEQCGSHDNLKNSNSEQCASEYCGSRNTLKVSNSQECSFRTTNESMSTTTLPLHVEEDYEEPTDGNKKNLAFPFYTGAYLVFLFVASFYYIYNGF
jgi:hypothetical protein